MSHRYCPGADDEKQEPSFWEEAAEALVAAEEKDLPIVGHDLLEEQAPRPFSEMFNGEPSDIGSWY